ncbi:MAG: helix-turn-helix transcriptional regulator [Knoellia sp.]
MNAFGPDGTGMTGDAVGAAMRLARRRLGLSQRALAEALGWDRARVGRWESGVVPEGFEEVAAVLRLLGFHLVLTDPAAPEWADWDDPAEHILDRADRRFPAHLELCAENALSTWNWARHRGQPSPNAAQNSFRRRSQAEVVAEAQRWRTRDRSTDGAGTDNRDSLPPASQEC